MPQAYDLISVVVGDPSIDWSNFRACNFRLKECRGDIAIYEIIPLESDFDPFDGPESLN